MIREKEKCNIENCLRFREKSAMILLYIWEWGIYILFALEIMEGGLDYGKRKCTIIVGLARQEHSAVFQCVKSYFIQFITNQLPKTWSIMPCLRLFAFAERMVV